MLQFHSTSLPQASDFMTETVIALHPEESMWRGVKTLLEGRVSGAPVIDHERRVVGVLTEKDCVIFLINARYYDKAAGPVQGHMTRDVVTVRANDDIFTIADLFREHSFRRLPVLNDDNQLIGIVSRRDLMRTGMMMWRPKEAEGAPFVPENLKTRVGNSTVISRPDLHG